MKRWAWNILVWADQGVNVWWGWLLNHLLKPAFHFGDPDETLSSVFGKNAVAGKCRFCGWVCDLLDRIDPGHCLKNIEKDEGSR